jgi:hypothetical protein
MKSSGEYYGIHISELSPRDGSSVLIRSQVVKETHEKSRSAIEDHAWEALSAKP